MRSEFTIARVSHDAAQLSTPMYVRTRSVSGTNNTRMSLARACFDYKTALLDRRARQKAYAFAKNTVAVLDFF